MQLPFIVLSYGQFAVSKKLFSYERDGINIMPIFTDYELANMFITHMNLVLCEAFDDERKLTAQLCQSINSALDMFRMVSIYVPGLYIAVNQLVAGLDEPIVLDSIKSIDTIIDDLQAMSE